MNTVQLAGCMDPLRISFIISKLTEEEMEDLQAGHTIVTKMILTPDDHKLFHYEEGSRIQVETQQGNRLWCIIRQMETLTNESSVILLFTLTKAEG